MAKNIGVIMSGIDPLAFHEKYHWTDKVIFIDAPSVVGEPQAASVLCRDAFLTNLGLIERTF